MIEDEHPLGAERIAAALGARVVRFEVAESQGTVRVVNGRCAVGGFGPGDVSLVTTAETIDALLAGHTSLVETVLRGDLELRGNLEAVACMHDVWLTWLNAALRCRSIRRLNSRWRGER